MIRYTQGNLLAAEAEALVNTVNTVGISGKGIALMFKEAFAENFRAYQAAAKAGRVVVGDMFVTERHDMLAAAIAPGMGRAGAGRASAGDHGARHPLDCHPAAGRRQWRAGLGGREATD
jgi:O-acetyl-ADP-ribose deacetylase (regulator of RNase III)